MRALRETPLGLVRVLVGVVFVVRTTPLVRVLSPEAFFREGPLWGWPEGTARLSLLGLGSVHGLVPPAWLVAALAVARVAAGAAFLVGFRARVAGVFAALSGWFLIASEPLSFIHTVHALHLSVLLIALGDGASELALRPDPPTCRASSVALLRAHLIAIYAFAAFAKLDSAWLSGETLHTLARYSAVGPLGPAVFATLDRARACAWGAVGVEAALPVLLALPWTRRAGVVLAIALHVGFELTVRPDVLGFLALSLLPVFLTPAVAGVAAVAAGQRASER